MTEFQQTLHYIRDMLNQLIRLVPPEAGRTLPYLLDVAKLEANELIASEDQKTSET
ncbi:hypothetical protein GCM10011390_03850 [Aureimonas endophytica]|uniref:Uncharacterized protein n=1 Tax=Aureimonas endophytica TaxID=2027858 RepID=A0A916ZCQ5_9HYPH|nr:hypothetical protein [Aureimonas endophytica]GGD88297.1 hypothetical protein GCM10011390_03850 [Aureimonas endophytica]